MAQVLYLSSFFWVIYFSFLLFWLTGHRAQSPVDPNGVGIFQWRTLYSRESTKFAGNYIISWSIQ